MEFTPKKKAELLINRHLGLGYDTAKHIALHIVDEITNVLFLDEIISLDKGHERIVDYWENVKNELNAT